MKRNKMKNKAHILILGAVLCSSSALVAQDNINALDYILQKRPGVDTIPGNRWSDHLFINAGVGIQTLLNESRVPGRAKMGPVASLSIGKWFNSISAVRVGLQAGMLSHNQTNPIRNQFYHAGLSVDYMFNLTNHLYGYDHRRIFSLIPFAGVSGQVSALHRDNIKPVASLRGGLQASFRVTHGMKLFLEPTVNMYSDNFSQSSNWRKIDFVPSMMLGFAYDKVPKIYRSYADPFHRNQGPFSHLFFSAAIGPNTLLSSTAARSSFTRLGVSSQIMVGTWFNPGSGLRLGVGAEAYRRKDDILSDLSLQLDYLANLTSMFEGYDADRIFSLYALAGLNLRLPEQMRNTDLSFGAGAGLQANFRVSPVFQLFIEPRVNVQSNKFAGGYSSGHFDLPAQVLFGMTYQRSGSQPVVRRPFERTGWESNYFVYAGAGVNALVSGYLKYNKFKALRPVANVGMGKWFTPTSGARVYAQASALRESYNSSKLVGVGVDYLSSLTNLISGYDPGRKFDLQTSVGGSVVYRTSESSRSSYEFGLIAGLQALWHVSPSVFLYIEPQAGLYTDGLAAGSLPPLRADVLAMAKAGLVYRFKNYESASSKKAFMDSDPHKWFLSLAGGVQTNANRDISSWVYGPRFELKAGKQYTALSSWRAGIMYAQSSANKRNKATEVAAEADYMLDLTTLSYSYRPDRLFTMYGITGLSLGVRNQYDKSYFAPGVHAGLQANFRVNKQFSLFVEPRMGVDWRDSDDVNAPRKIDLNLSAQVGATWRFDSSK